MEEVVSINLLQRILVFEGALVILLVTVWWRVLRQHSEYLNWKRKASLIALICPTAALGLEFVCSRLFYLEGTRAVNRDSDRPSLHDDLNLVFLVFTPGVLSIFGIVAAMLGVERPRLAGAVFSFLVVVPCIFNLVLAGNSFH